MCVYFGFKITPKYRFWEINPGITFSRLALQGDETLLMAPGIRFKNFF